MNLNLTNVVLLLAGAQGFFLTIILMRRYRKLYANRFLAAMIALFSLVLLYLFAYEIGYIGKHPHLIQVFLGFCLLLPPLHYLYAYFLIHRGRRFQKRIAYIFYRSAYTRSSGSLTAFWSATNMLLWLSRAKPNHFPQRLCYTTGSSS